MSIRFAVYHQKKNTGMLNGLFILNMEREKSGFRLAGVKFSELDGYPHVKPLYVTPPMDEYSLKEMIKWAQEELAALTNNKLDEEKE